MFIDTHTHLYLEEFDNDLEAVIRRSLDSNVTKLLLPNIDLHSWGPMLGLCDAFPGICLPMAGVHPTSVTRDSIEDELNKVIEQLKTGRYIAVGEIGIDLYWDKTFQAEQEQVFAKQLQLAKDFKLPVAIHMRNSFEEVWNVLKNEISPELKGVFHCFSGNLVQARQVIDAGFMLGIGGVVTFKNSGLQDVIKEVGLEHLILETDAPYLAPVPYRGQRNEPSYIPIIASKIAEITATPLTEVAAITTRNARSLFGI
ncbi:MAG: TatD family hydrolase [Bacteroidales bacterium]|nr:TatD family hydrolase [Bacteroidales bacterium]